MKHQRTRATLDGFPEQPDYLELETGGDDKLPPMVVTHDGPLPTTPHPARSFTTGQFPVTTAPARIAPHNVARRSLTLTNTGAATAYLAPSEGECTSGFGFPLAAGASLTLDTSHDVWAVCGTSTTVAVLAQLEDGR